MFYRNETEQASTDFYVGTYEKTREKRTNLITGSFQENKTKTFRPNSDNTSSIIVPIIKLIGALLSNRS